VKIFHETHERIYGFNRQSEELELINIRLIGIGKIRELIKDIPNIEVSKHFVEPISVRLVFFNDAFVSTPIYQRSDLNSDVTIKGPAIIEQLDSTIIIHPDQKTIVDHSGNLIISLSDKQVKEEEVYEFSSH
jgi:N-methylhydantoinase A